MKKYLLILMIVSPFLVRGQFSAEIAAGFTNIKPAFKTEIGYKYNSFAISGGYVCHLSNLVKAGAIPNIRIGYYLTDKIELSIGEGWNIKSTDNKEINTKGILCMVSYSPSFVNISGFYYPKENIFGVLIGFKGFIQ